MQRPDWLKPYVSEKDLDRIQEAVRAFEGRSGLEVVPLIVRRSSPIGHVAVIITLALCLVMTLAVWDLQEFLPWGWEIPALVGGYALSFLASFGLARSETLQRWLTPDFDEELNVERRAWSEFAAMKISSQSRRAGVLVMISLMEHRVMWAPDDSVRHLLPPEIWKELADRMAQGLKAGDWFTAFESSLGRLSEAASRVLPSAAKAADELGNALQIRE